MRSVLSRLALLPLLAFAAACDDDSSGPRRLAADEVAGSYRVCSLVFDPDGNAFAPVDVRETAFESSNAELPAPTLAVNPNGTAQLQYVRKGQFSINLNPARYTTRSQGVSLSFDRPTEAQSLLLPGRLELAFTATPKALDVASTQSAYTVSYADYARLTGTTDPNAPQILTGRLSGRFQVGGCG